MVGKGLMLATGIVIVTAAVAACYAPQLIDRFWVSWIPVCIYIAYINPRLRLIGILISSFLWTTAVIYWQLDHRLSLHQDNKRLVAVGEVLNIPKTSLTSTNFLFKPLSIDGYDGRYPNKIRLNWRNAPEQLRPGQIWQLQLKLKRPHGFQNPGGFDYERWMFAKGIHATGYVVKSELNTLQNDTKLSLNSLRYGIKLHIEKSCLNCKNSGLIEALAIGFRGGYFCTNAHCTESDRDFSFNSRFGLAYWNSVCCFLCSGFIVVVKTDVCRMPEKKGNGITTGMDRRIDL